MSRARRLFADIGPLREFPDFRRLWAGTTLSAVGGALTMFAVPLQVYEITGSPLAVGAIGVAELIPAITIGLLGGTFADAVDRRKLVLAASSCDAAVSAGLAAQAFAGLHRSGCSTSWSRCRPRSARSAPRRGGRSSRACSRLVR